MEEIMMKLIIPVLFLLSAGAYAKSIEKSICGVDDRVPSMNKKIARALDSRTGTGGCTLTMISRSCGISAGHCKSVLKVAEFNTPASRNGRIQHPAAEDVYEINQETLVSTYTTIGNDYAVFNVMPNNVTGLYAGDVQGFYDVAFESAKVGEEIRITGYGLDRSDPTRNLAQQTHTGKVVKNSRGSQSPTALYHIADTMGGNSGSSIISEETGKIVGIHTNGGCSSRGGNNAAQMIAPHTELVAAIRACLLNDEAL
jgi:V8-like Glu-specific endopeptidase